MVYISSCLFLNDLIFFFFFPDCKHLDCSKHQVLLVFQN